MIAIIHQEYDFGVRIEAKLEASDLELRDHSFSGLGGYLEEKGPKGFTR